MPTAAVNAHPTAADRLRTAGWQVVPFAPGPDLDAFALAGRADAVLDLRLTDLADGTAGPDRLTAASVRGLPLVVGPGGLPADLTPEAADRLALDVAQKVSASNGPAAVVLPTRGRTPAAEVFDQAVRNWAYGFEVVEVDAAADDPAFAAAAADILRRLAQSAGS
jgi:uncharacterized protein (UPF0261 family)